VRSDFIERTDSSTQEILGAIISQASSRLGGVKSQLFAEGTSEARFFAVVELERNIAVTQFCVLHQLERLVYPDTPSQPRERFSESLATDHLETARTYSELA
jgi:hypothetical protein